MVAYAMPNHVVSLQAITKSFGNVRALDGVDLTVDQGAAFGFLGPNGAGKTTCIRIVTGFIKPTGGRAHVFGMDAWRDTVPIKRRIGFLPEASVVDGNATGAEFLRYMARLRGLRSLPAYTATLADRLELSGAALRRGIRGYSQGMRKKVAIIQALQHQPDLLIMDEPTDGLDPLMRQVFFDLLREAKARGATTFMSSHVLSDVEDACDTVALIRDGRIVSAGTVDSLRAGRERVMAVTFRGEPPASLSVDGARILERAGATLTLGVSGDVNGVIRALSRYDLTDFVYERLRLEELFMGYYGHESEPPAKVLEGRPR